MGAWWLGYLIAGTITLVSAVPFWFLPKSLPVPVDKHDLSCTPEQTRFITDSPNLEHKFRQEEPPDLQQMAKGASSSDLRLTPLRVLAQELFSNAFCPNSGHYKVTVTLHFKCFFHFSADFVPTLRTLFGNPVYIVYLCVTILQFNSLIGMVTYKPKYIEQHYGQSASTANFLMGEQSSIVHTHVHNSQYWISLKDFCDPSLRKLLKDAK